jgi:hypothetical protein
LVICLKEETDYFDLSWKHSIVYKDVNTHWDLTVALKVKALKKLRAFLFKTKMVVTLELGRDKIDKFWTVIAL